MTPDTHFDNDPGAQALKAAGWGEVTDKTEEKSEDKTTEGKTEEGKSEEGTEEGKDEPPGKPQEKTEEAKPEVSKDAGEEGKTAEVDYEKLDYEKLSDGQFKSKEEFTKAMQALNSIEGDGNITERLNALTESANKIPEPLKYASEYVEKLDKWVSGGGDKGEFERIHGIDVKEIKDIDALKADFRITTKSKISDEDLTVHFNDKYKQSEDYTEQEQKLGLIAMAIDAEKAKLSVVEMQKTNALPPPAQTAKEWQDNENKRLEGWKGQVKPFVDEIKSLELTLPGKSGKTFNYVIPEGKDGNDIRADIQQHVETVIANTSLVAGSTEATDLVRNLAKERLWSANKETIMLAYGEYIRNMSQEEYDETAHHVSPETKGEQKPIEESSSIVKSWGEQIAEAEGMKI